jgi:murein DD-endopeptidase MepM/ murein hydrolase activator NlpD
MRAFGIQIAGLPLLLSASLCSAQPGAPPNAGPQLVLPVDCEIGKSCLIQKLVDHDPGPGRRDYRCGNLTTDGHDGVDIRLRTMQDMADGYPVIAAAAGTVLRTRDGEPDISSRVRTDRNGKDAGNGVVIDHGNGWESQYSHLKMGSIGVRPGQKVEPGDRLGLIGMSGNSEFPHLHFSVRLRGTTVDPYIGRAAPSQCNASAASGGMWAPAAARSLAYAPTILIAAGLASQVPPRSVADRTETPTIKGRDAPLLLWVDVIGAKSGDIQEFGLTGPNGESIHAQTGRIDDGGLSWFAFSGKRPPEGGWKPGRYTGRYVLKRNGAALVRQDVFGEVK